MSQQSFNGQVKTLLKNGQIDAQSFWKALQQSNYEENAAYYGQQIFQTLTKPQPKYLSVQIQDRMLSTLLALSYYKDRKPKSQQVLASFRKYLEKDCPFYKKWILQIFISPHKDQNFAKVFMSQLVLLPEHRDINLCVQGRAEQIIAFITSQNFLRKQLLKNETSDYSRLRSCSFPTPIGIRLGTISLAYVCFLDYIRGSMNEMKLQEYEYMIETMRVLVNYARNGQIWIHYLCVFIHFVESCLTFYSCCDPNLLKQFLILASQIRNCWGPLGEMGSQLFQIVHKELKVPGHAFRKKLRYDFPTLDMKQSTFLNKQFYIVTQDQDSFSCPEDRSLLNLRKLMIWHLMKVSNLSQQQIDECIDMLRSMANDLTFQFYFKSMKIAEIASQLEIYDKIKPIMRQNMLDLINQMRERLKKQSKRASEMQIEEFDSLIQDDNTLHIFRYPLYEIIHIPIADFINTKSKASFLSIINKVRRQQSNYLFYRGSISIIFYGNSLDFINVVRIMSRFLEEADVEECRQLQIFYLPKPEPSCRSEIASYIAAKDIWYRNFIYQPFKTKSLHPHLPPSHTSKHLFPSYLLNKTVHLYLRQARRTFHLRTYKCILKIKDVSHLETVYFTSSVLVGLMAEAEIIRAGKEKSVEKVGKYEGRNGLEIVEEKMEKGVILVGDIEIQYVQPVTNVVGNRKESNFRFEDLQICNMPRQNFFGQKPDPSGNTLKMSLLSESNAKIFRRQLKNKQNFRQNKLTEQIGLAFSDIFINYSIRQLSLRNKKQDTTFRVVIDGVIYSKVEGFNIQSPVSVNGTPIALPIQTFLPFK